MEKTMSAKHLPKTDSIEELAHFWDTHDLTDFEDELEEVSGSVFDKDKTITLHLQSSEAEAVRQLANASGVPEEDLIRTWVLEKLNSR
jgi:predicted DNA binding CopG/RHH family protein